MILLNAQRSYQQARLALVQAQAARFADTAALFQALGGGWWNRVDVRARSVTARSRRSCSAASDLPPPTEQRSRAMIKRMVIMLVAVAIVFGGIFGFQVFKAAMIKKFISPHGIAAADGLGDQGRLRAHGNRKIEAVGSLRAVKGADLSLEVSGVVDSISFNSGDDVAGRARCCSSCARPTMSPSSNRSRPWPSLNDITYRARPEAIQDAGGQPGDDRYRCRQPEERQGAGRAAAGHHRQEVSCARRLPAISASAP